MEMPPAAERAGEMQDENGWQAATPCCRLVLKECIFVPGTPLVNGRMRKKQSRPPNTH